MSQPFSRTPALLFALFLTVIAAPFLSRVAAIAPLFLDTSVRDRASVALRQVASREGWLLSDLSIRRVDDTSMRVVRQAHQRVATVPQCFIVKYSTFESFPCAD